MLLPGLCNLQLTVLQAVAEHGVFLLETGLMLLSCGSLPTTKQSLPQGGMQPRHWELRRHAQHHQQQ